MAKVTVLFFSYAADRMNGRQAVFEMSEGTTVEAFFQAHLKDKLRQPIKGLMFSINEEWASPQATLHDGDQLAVIPPVSGG